MDQKPKSVVVTSDPGKSLFRRCLPAILIGLGVFVVLVVGIYIYQVNSRKPAAVAAIPTNACSTVAAGDDLLQAGQDLSHNNSAPLKAIVTNIKTLPYYQNDPNCNYVITMYYVYNDDLANAQKSLSQFNSSYKNLTLSPYLLHFGSAADLRTYVSALASQQADLSKDANGVSYQYKPSTKK